MRQVPSLLSLLTVSIIFNSTAHAVIPLNPEWDWQSNPLGQVATGLGVADLNGDGWIDHVVANGNDIYRQPVAVYLNQGDGTFPSNPSWISSDIDYHGHLDLADVDGDGNLDCGVAVYLGPGGFGSPGRVKLYAGNGDGTFSAYPIWQSSDSFYCFSVAFGDLDTDGDPDLACATGDDYYNNAEQRRVYRNVGGQLGSTPAWMSQENEYSLDAVWADFNEDGRLDLAFAGTSGPNRIYFATPGGLETQAGWSSTDVSIYANTVTAGDVNGDGSVDLAIADNYQLGGYGRAKIYYNLGNGTLSESPDWQSSQGWYGSHVSFIDIDEDADLDLATGGWWDPVRIYENDGGGLGTAPAYTSATNSVIENEVWEDFDNDGIQYGLGAAWAGDGERRLFLLPTRPARKLIEVTVAGSAIDPADIYLDSDDAWLVLPEAPAAGTEIHATYVGSADVDLLLSNWDDDRGQFLFYNLRNPVEVSIESPPFAVRLHAGPNPSAGTVRLVLENAPLGRVGLWEVFDARGRRIRSWETRDPITEWDGRDEQERSLLAGVYWIRWSLPGERSIRTKVIRR